MTLRLNGSTSGYVEIDAPAVAGTSALTLPTGTGTLATQASVGLVKIVDQSFTAVSSVSVNNCFSSAYANYLLIVKITASADTLTRFRLRASGTDDSSNNYGIAYLNPASANVTESAGYVTYPSTSKGAAQLHLYDPAIAEVTAWNTYGGNYGQVMFAVGRHNVATSYDGITFYPPTGTITGTLRVYGYQN